LAATGWGDGYPQDLRAAWRPPAGYREPGYGAGVGEHPAVMAGRIPLDHAGDVAGEVIRQAADDGRDRRHIRVGEAADDVHYVIVPHLARPAAMSKPTRITNSIRALRFAHGEMTQAQLAERVGVTRQTIIAIEQGRYSPSLEMAFQIARVFRVPLDEVFQYPDGEGELR
jgi:putative transcriptional regulator